MRPGEGHLQNIITIYNDIMSFMEKFLPKKETTQKALKYVESLGKTALVALLMQ